MSTPHTILSVARARGAVAGGLELFAENLNVGLEHAGCQVIRVPGARAGGLAAEYLRRGWRGLRLACSARTPITHTIVHYGNFLDVLLAFVLSFSRPPVFVVAHVGANWYHLKNRLLRAMTRMFLGRRRIVILCLTTEQTGIFSGCATASIPTIIPAPYAHPPRRTAGRQPRTVLFIGRVSRTKGVLDLLVAHAGLRTPDVLLRVVGPVEAAFDPELRAAIASSPVSRRVEVLPPVFDDERKRELYADCDVVALPSHMEALPLTMMEALACGVPVIVSRVGDCPVFMEEIDEFLTTAGDPGELSRKLDQVLAGPGDASALARLQAKARAAASGALVERLRGLGLVPAPSARPGAAQAVPQISRQLPSR